MSARLEFKGVVFRLFKSETEAQRAFAYPMEPVEFECGWLVRDSTGTYYDDNGRLRDNEAAIVDTALAGATPSKP